MCIYHVHIIVKCIKVGYYINFTLCACSQMHLVYTAKNKHISLEDGQFHRASLVLVYDYPRAYKLLLRPVDCYVHAQGAYFSVPNLLPSRYNVILILSFLVLMLLMSMLWTVEVVWSKGEVTRKITRKKPKPCS